jgi:hypothetical protein
MNKYILAFLIICVSLGPLHAACFADYRASAENPLRLHYGVMELSQEQCTLDAVRGEISRRLSANGWQLLQVVSVFGEDELNQREADAREFFLRY